MLRRTVIPADAAGEDLLQPLFRGGHPVADLPPPAEARARCLSQLAALDPSIKRLANPHRYPAGLEISLHQMKLDLVEQSRAVNPT